MDIITLNRDQGKEIGGGYVWCDCPKDSDRPHVPGFYCKGVPLLNGLNCCERNIQQRCYIGKITPSNGILPANKFRISQTTQGQYKPTHDKLVSIRNINRSIYKI